MISLLLACSSPQVPVSQDVHNNDTEESNVLLTGDLACTGVSVQVVSGSCQGAARTVQGYNLLPTTYSCCGC
ncbi:MAG: hypothetical protein ACI9VR_003943 [Cognaticolwellia sp.]|jgi:hypothetical protein